MSFSTQEKANLLFKKYLGKPSILDDRPFFQEPNRGSVGASFPAVLSGQIWTQDIPQIAPLELSSLTESSLDDNGNVMKGSYAGKTSNDGIIKRYIKVPLVLALGANDKAYEATQTNVSSHPNGYADGVTPTNYGIGSYSKITQDMIPFNFDILGSYNVQLYKSNEIEIPFGETGGEWIPDKESGIITFYQFENISGVNTSNPPLFSFYRYVGDKGLTNLSVTGIGSGGSTGVFYNDVHIDPDVCPSTDLTINDFSNFFTIGDTTLGCTGAWRIGIQGPATSGGPTSLIHQYFDGTNWITKQRLYGASC